MPDAAPPPEERRLDTIAAQREAIDALLALATQRVHVFDRDLADGGWDTAARAEALKAFLRRSRTAELRIVVHDTRHLERSCPRITALLRGYAHAMAVWRTGPEARSASDALVIVDARHALHRYHVDQPRATLLLSMPQAVEPLATRFDEIWATGEPALGGSVLGL
ncbi:MAG: hypothetical protein BroJett026_07980 [Betaproteobacteria bacterium]|nr:MAG: hypothetical protein BroJett026_07980 [Betaproteobacteria bacterium]